MRADDMAVHFQMEPHMEGGTFIELNDPVPEGEGRAPSGVIYYHLGSGEFSDFHVLDSDEFWLWHAGSTLELWVAGENGGMEIRRLGAEADAEPCVLIRGGTVFGARHLPGAEDGTFVSCVTVPRFSYAHYRILDREEMLKKYPASAAFFDGLAE